MRCWLIDRVGFRGATLLWLMLLDFVYGLSLLRPAPEASQSASIRWVAQILPLPAWGAAWSAMGVLLAVYAFRRRDAAAFAVAVTWKVVWGLLFLIGWIVGAVDRGWVAAVVWLAFAGWASLVSRWPEPPPLVREPPCP